MICLKTERATVKVFRLIAEASLFALSVVGFMPPDVAAEQVGAPDILSAPAISQINKVQLAQVIDLSKRTALLVESSKSADTPASEFRIETVAYREDLRKLVRGNPSAGTPGRIPDALLQEMIRMSGLLHAAAQCKTGRYIVCPADLIRQLVAQQQRIGEQIKTLGER